MSKSAVITLQPQQLLDDVPFKRNLFYFDEFKVCKELFFEACRDVELRKEARSPLVLGQWADNYKRNLRMFDTLFSKGIISFWAIEDLNLMKWDLVMANTEMQRYLLEQAIIELDDFRRAWPDSKNNVDNHLSTQDYKRQLTELEDKIIPSIKRSHYEQRRRQSNRHDGLEISARNVKSLNANFFSRRFVQQHLQQGNTDVFPLFLERSPVFTNYEKEGKHDVIRFVLPRFPEPDETMPLDEILDFKHDSKVKAKYFALVNWVNTVSKQDLSASELQDFFNQCYHEYAALYDQYHVNHRFSTFEIVFNGIGTIAQLLSGMIFKPGMVFDALFRFQKEKMDLQIEELKLPNREIAYIHLANKR